MVPEGAVPESFDKGDAPSQKSFIVVLAVITAVLAAIPYLIGIAAQNGTMFLGFPYATDDHMVYSAWMRQAQEGRFLLDNRFTFDSQPSLTVHLYFFVLGLLSKATGIILASELARIVLTVVFVLQVHKFAGRFVAQGSARNAVSILVCFASGLGFLVWHMFGETISKPANPAITNVMLARLPVDVWQPEAFVFPSMVTNGLFMAALCLMMIVLGAILDAKDSWKPVGKGALAMLVLMNIHSYDVLIVLAAAVGLVAMLAYRRELPGAWLIRGAAIFAGAIPSALWFLNVLSQDAVFRARAETPTYAPNFRQVLIGYLLLVALGLAGLVMERSGAQERKRALIGIGLYTSLIAVLFALAQNHTGQYFMNWAGFGGCMAIALVCAVMVSGVNHTKNLIIAWALLGLLLPYFPALFQRKLAMGLSVPWAILAALTLSAHASQVRQKFSKELALAALAFIVSIFGSLFWLQRQTWFLANNVTRTTMQPMQLQSDAVEIIEKLNAADAHPRVLVIPGIANPLAGPDGQLLPDQFGTPYLPDLNPVLSGLTGCYTYCGHWSETPNYNVRRGEATMFFLSAMPEARRREFLAENQIDYIVGPVRSAYPELAEQGLIDLSAYGELVVNGPRMMLVRVSR